MIRLCVPASNNEAEKKYSYFQLVDLHDKLTLVVGKMEEQQNIIRYFEDVKLFYYHFLELFGLIIH